MTRTLVWCGARGIPAYGPSGASAHLRGVARALIRRGHDVILATPLADDARGRWDDADPLPAVHAAPWAWPAGLRTLGARVDGHRLALAAWDRPELVWERHEPATAAARRWAWASGARRVVELNAPLSLERRWPRAARAGALRREVAALRGADRVVAVSAWLRDWAVDVAGCGAERVVHVPNGVAPQGPGDRDGARVRLGLDGPVVGFVGSMRGWQGADGLPGLLDALPGWRGLAVGPADGVGAHPRLVRTGAVHEGALPDLVAAMDVAVAPYRADAPPWLCPLKVLQYRAQGVPVVCADLGDARLLVGDGGAVLPLGAPVGAWAEAVRQELGRTRVAAVRTWDDVVAEALA